MISGKESVVKIFYFHEVSYITACYFDAEWYDPFYEEYFIINEREKTKLLEQCP